MGCRRWRLKCECGLKRTNRLQAVERYKPTLPIGIFAKTPAVVICLNKVEAVVGLDGKLVFQTAHKRRPRNNPHIVLELGIVL